MCSFPLVQEKFVGSSVPQILEETVEVMKLVPQERGQRPTVEHVPAPQNGSRGGIGSN